MNLHYIDGSPFARMARVLILEHGLPVTLEEVTDFPPSAAHLALNPLGQVPVLVTADAVLFPTRIILDELLARASAGEVAAAVSREGRAREDEQVLAVILAMGDALVARQYAKWAGMAPIGRNRLGFDPVERNLARALATLDWLEARIGPDGFHPGIVSVQDIALACLILWTESRGPVAWRGRPRIEALVARLERRPAFIATVPPPLPWS
jgi:glutathione S-transferase